MRNAIRFLATKETLPVILIAAVIQGWALYALHQSAKHSFWPGTEWQWLIALYAVALFIPLTIQFLSEHAKSRAHWAIVAGLALAYFYFGWHYGSAVVSEPIGKFPDSADLPAAGIVAGLLWLLAMPFIQVRLSTGRWIAEYSRFFETAWRNKLMLAEAGLFTGSFWLLLQLWQMLFYMLGIGYFRQLFQEPLFVYPVTTITFGVALHLIGSIERLTAAILEQLLNVLKWLAIVAGIILALFTVALVFKLPGLVFTGQKAIGAAWLLWLIAGIVLLINSAYRDGSVQQPYPRWIAFGLRCVIPLTVIVAATALYSLIVRAQHFGLTVGRVWAFVVATAAFLYAVGYSIAAFRKGAWLQLVSRVNVAVALALMAILALTLTPILSPHRLAANSQFRVSLEKTASTDERAHALSSFRYLRFDSGKYGLDKLKELSIVTDHPDAKRIQTQALAALKSQNRWEATQVETTDLLAKMKIYPTDHPVDDNLRRKLIEESAKLDGAIFPIRRQDLAIAGIFVDLRSDGSNQFVLLNAYGGAVFQQVGEDWELKGRVAREDMSGQIPGSFEKEFDSGNIKTTLPEWKQLELGAFKFHVTSQK